MKQVDARGLLCPEPVVCTQRAIKDGEKELTVLVDAEAAKENVIRFAVSRGYSVSVSGAGGEYSLALKKG